MSAPLAFSALKGRIALRIERRALFACAALGIALLIASLAALLMGEFPVGLQGLWQALTGTDEGPLRMVVIEWRLPRALMALMLGAALGASGAIFQSLSRNPLGSPDVIGLNAGAYSGALLVMIFLGGSALLVSAGAVLGGIAAALAVYLLAWRGGLQGFRLVIVGIGMGAMLTALNTWLLLSARLEVAMGAAIWGAGSLNGITLGQLGPVALLLGLVLMPALFLLSRPLAQMETGDELAKASGIALEPVRLGLIGVGVGLSAVATAAAGPIAFVALAAPQIGARLAGSGRAALLPAALTGALLLALSDLVAAHAFAPRQLPVGVVTLALGGLYLLWLLAREARRQ